MTIVYSVIFLYICKKKYFIIMGKEDIEKMVTDTGMMLFTKSDVINLITQAIELERMNHV